MSLIFSESWTCLPLFFLPPPMSPSAPSRHTNFARPSLSPLRGDRKLRSAPAENSARARSRLAGAREIDEFSFTSLETIQSHPLTFFFSPLSTLPLFSLQHTFHNSPPRRRRPPRCPPCRRRRRVSDGRELRAKKSRMNELFFFNFFVRLSAIVTQLIDSFFFFSSSAFFFLFFADPLSLNPATLFQKKKKKTPLPPCSHTQRLRRGTLLLAPQGPARPRHRLPRLDRPGRLPFPFLWRGLALRLAARGDEQGPRRVPDAAVDRLALLDLPGHL